MSNKPWEDKVLFKTVGGSHLYGTATPESDVDVRGVCEQTVESLIGLSPFEQYKSGTEDTEIYGIVKFCKLAAECNPNIIELLFADYEADSTLYVSDVWIWLVDNYRDAFVSRKARHTFSGYAYSQLERINRHHRWMVNGAPPDPDPEEYGAVPTSSSDKNNLWKWPNNDLKNKYQNAREIYRQWQHWIKERNPARKELEEKFGYDTKNGMHLARLMIEGEELLTTGFITLPRPDAPWLLEVRNGLMSYEEIVQWASDYQDRLVKLDEESKLPFGSDFNRVQEAVMKINWMTLEGESVR